MEKDNYFVVVHHVIQYIHNNMKFNVVQVHIKKIFKIAKKILFNIQKTTFEYVQLFHIAVKCICRYTMVVFVQTQNAATV